MEKEDCKSPKDATEDSCGEQLIQKKTTSRPVKGHNRYKLLVIIFVLILVVQSCVLVYTVINFVSDRTIGICPESERTIWIPRKQTKHHDIMTADSSNFYCRTLDHKLYHLIDFLVMANRSTVPAKTHRSSLIWAETTRPATQILHFHAIQGSRFFKGLRLKDGHEVGVLKNGSVLIQKDGIYCVYSIITFVHAPSDTDIPNDECWINRSRHSDQKTILANRVDQAGQLVTDTYRTVDLSGNFYLKKGDMLTPVIRNKSAVLSYSPANFWGVYQVKPKTLLQ